jgi:amino acid adenylation domain-containing protein
MSAQINTDTGTNGWTAASRKEQALWLLEVLAPGSAANNLAVAFRVDGRLRTDVLSEACSLLLRRHEVLRTVYRDASVGLVRSVRGPGADRVEVVEADPADELDTELTAYIARPFAFDGTPLLRACRFRQPDGDAFCLVLHHLVFDTLSAPTLLEELVHAYTELAAGRQPPAELCRPAPAMAESEPRPESLEFWQQELAGVDVSSVGLWCGTPDTAEPSLSGGHLIVDLPPEVLGAVGRLQRRLRAPQAVVMLAAYLVLLSAHGAGEDVVVGSPLDVRPLGATGVIGYHINVLPIRVRVDPEATVRSLVRSTREVFFNALMHSDVPVDSMLAGLPRADSSWRQMLFRHVFNYVPGLGLPDFRIGGLAAQPLLAESGESKFDLEFFVMSTAEQVRLRVVYRREVLGETDARDLAERYGALLLALDGDDDRPVRELSVWSARDRAAVDAANATAGPVEPATVLEAVRRRVAADPAVPAVQDGDREVSYGALWVGADRVRAWLAGAGVGAGDTVALLGPRSPELAAAVLGVWLADAVYLPIDPEHPRQRIEYQLADSGARAVLAAPGLTVPEAPGRTVLTWPAVPDDGAPQPGLNEAAAAALGQPDALGPDPRSAAYLMYTSGSTGVPKGALIPHGALANLVCHFADELRVGPGDAALWLTTFSFDISGLELFVPLWSGGRVVVGPDRGRIDGAALGEVVERHDVRVVQATPTTWRAVLDAAGPRLAGRRALVGGEPAPAALLSRLLAAGCTPHHVYGPTETTIWSTSAVVPKDFAGPVDVGAPIRNTQITVLSPDGRELPPGVVGEVCVAGAGVALGYHARPELNVARFGVHPRHGRFYRTGDLGRWCQGGTLELLGRTDRQIKLRGNRIELGEVEAAVAAHPGVAAVAVLADGDLSADATLVAFLVPRPGAALDTAGVWEHARAALPRSVVPAQFVVIDALPVTLNDKVDYKALTALARERRAATAGGAAQAPDGGRGAPEGAEVGMLVDLWGELLQREDVTPDTNFFTHGGHSLLGAMLTQRVEETTGVSLRLAELFGAPTPRELAALLDRPAGTGQPVALEDPEMQTQPASASAD